MTSYNGWQVTSQTKPLGVFWDIENCSVPTGKSAISVCDKIRKQDFFRDHRETLFAVVCDATKESKTILEELDKAQVDIIHVASNRKNAADDKLKQLMRRFADLHRDGSRIVLISGDMDFAADIADFKRRMCLSVILLHNSNASESLILAASQVYNFYDILATLPVKRDSSTIVVQDEIIVSNLPSISDCSESSILRILNKLASQFDGSVTAVHGVNGNAVLKFPSSEQAKLFKNKFLHFKIEERPINIHFVNKTFKSSFNRCRAKSFSQSPEPSSSMRQRTRSESSKRIVVNTEDNNVACVSSQDSLLVYGSDEDCLRQPQPIVEDLPSSFNHLSVSDKINQRRRKSQRNPSGSSLGHTSGEEELRHKRLQKKTHSKIRSKLKLKSRKKSEATHQFLNRRDVNENRREEGIDEDMNFSENVEAEDKPAKLATIAQNLTLIIDTQLVRLDLIGHLYKERYQADLINQLRYNGIHSLPNFINEICKDLTTINFNMVPHIVSRKGEFVQNYLKRVNDVLYNLQRGNDYCPVPVPIFEHEYRDTHGIGAFLDLDFAARECNGIRKTQRSVNREFLELSILFMLGNEIVEVLNKKGGIVSLSHFLDTYRSVTGKNLDPANHGFDNIENLLKELDMFVKVAGKKKSVVLQSISNQSIHRRNRGTDEAEVDFNFARPDILEPTEPQNRSSINCINSSSRLDNLTRGLHPTVSPALRSLRQEHLFKSRKLRLTSFVNTRTQTWHGDSGEDNFVVESLNGDQDILNIENDGDVLADDIHLSTGDPADIITIEETASEDESPATDSNSNNQAVISSSRGRRKSRLAANFPSSNI